MSPILTQIVQSRAERLIRSACYTYEQAFFAETLLKLPQFTRERFDALLTRSIMEAETREEEEGETLAPAAVSAEKGVIGRNPTGGRERTDSLRGRRSGSGETRRKRP